MHTASIRASTSRIAFELDGCRVEACEGDSIASALLALGRRGLRIGPNGSPRGLFCGIGVCFDCLVTVDDVPGQRACMVRVREGMRVRCMS